MSTPAQSGAPTSREERRASLSKYVKRFKTVLKRASMSGPPAESSTGQTEAAAPEAKASQPEPAVPASDVGPIEVEPDTKLITEPVFSSTYARSAAQQERARALFAKYGLTLEPHEWVTTTRADVRRVEKPIRMRVHRTCHRCQTMFGADRVCANCEHRRCKKCPRYPAKRSKEEGADVKGKGIKGKEAIEESKTKAKPRTGPVTVTTRTHDSPILRLPPERQTCHSCDTSVVPVPTTFCPKCQHLRCEKCAKDDKYTVRLKGAATDEEGPPVPYHVKERTFKKPRQRVRWNCENCRKLFEAGSKTCQQCGHERCETCIREPPKKKKKEFDPEVVKSLEARLAAMAVRDGQPSTATTA